MAYTEAQWNKFQASLPAEERMSYLDYLKETDLAAYNKLVGKILENLKTAELQSGTPITKVVDEGTKIAGARTDKAAQKAATVAAAKVIPSFRAAEAAAAKTDSAATVSVSAAESAAQKRAAEAKEEADIKAEQEAAKATLAEKIATAKAAAEAAAAAAASGDPAAAAAAAEAAAAAAADADAAGALAGGDSTATDTAVATVETLNEPPGRPGKAWIVAADGKTWVKPGKPTDGKNYSWSDETGWISATEEKTAEEYTTVDGLLTFKGSPFTGSYNGKNYKDGKVVQEQVTDEYTTVGGVLMFKGAAFTGNYNGKNYKDGKIVEAAGDQYTTVNGLFTLNGKPFTGAYEGKNYKDGKLVEAPAEDNAADDTAGDTTGDAAAIAAEAKRQSAYDILYQTFAGYGLGSLVKPLEALIKSNVSPAEFAIKLRTDPLYNTAYKKRFAANDMRISKGLAALNEATYLANEDKYQNIMRNYGLPESYWKRGDLGVQEGFDPTSC
jgi:chemotaxis protein histidine kinase CheA